MNDRIRLKAACLHSLGKAEDFAAQQPPQVAAAQYLLGRFFDDLLQSIFRLKGFWLTAPADMLRFLSSRDAALGNLLERYLTATSLAERLDVGRQLVGLVFRDVPNPARID